MDFLLEHATPILITSIAVSALLFCLPTKHQPYAKEAAQAKAATSGSADGAHPEKRVVVLVLGDIGRSPRMQYHALSIVRNGGKVDLVGYNESVPRPEILSSDSITIHPITPPPSLLTTSNKLLFPIFAPIKILFQLYSLLNILIYNIPLSASYLLIQNPPAMPTLVVAWFVSRLRGMKVVVDWHNFGWTILGQKLGSHSAPIVLLAKLYERVFGRIVGDVNFSVTEAMKLVLRRDYGISSPIHTLHDRPPSHFQPLSPSAIVQFLANFPATSSHSSALASGKTKLLVSSTSWTPDENFQLLLDALTVYDRTAGLSSFLSLSSTCTPDPKAAPQLPHLLLIITGKGPLKSFYLQKIAQLELQCITIKTAWLEAEDYPKLLACADLGVCLHTSSSGIDLPMKVVDMFGVGVPVVAVDFEALPELVKSKENGVVVRDGEELGAVLTHLFNPSKPEELLRLKKGAEKETERRWDENWDKIAAPVFGFDG
ncbi:glycosyl transferases group 1-domain-containing protein [Kalaharituber pfeilii]|nr:glycosyl transferases group 1-domain-containing protein [Kalaharituber pfeilii]